MSFCFPDLCFKPPTELAQSLCLPVFSSAIRAGFPSPADDYVEQRLDLNDLLEHKEATFFAWVEGDSMQDLNIVDGDLMIIDRALIPESGDIVVAEVAGEFTVKKLLVRQHEAFLLPGNPKYAPIQLNGELSTSIWGVVVRVIHDMRQRKRRRKF